MNFISAEKLRNAKSIQTPRGELAMITSGEEVVWKKPKYKCEVEYLESTGTQKIDTGINADSNLGFNITYKMNSQTTPENRWGAIRQSGNTIVRHHTSTDTASNTFGYFLGSGRAFTLPTDIDKHTLSLDTEAGIYILDGVSATFRKSVFDCQLNFWIFGRNGNTESLVNIAPMTIYKCELYSSGVLVRDYIPVLDWNDVPCLYDKVTDELFYNQGTGEFLYGLKEAA